MSEQSHSENSDIQWALDLLKPDPNHELNFLQKYISEGICMGMGFGTACFKNFYNKRPVLSGLQIHIACVITGYVVSQVANKVIDHFKAERDTRLRTYVMLHPELFPKPERIKYADILKSWTPIR